jgi:ubiquinone/menaquinone biosynthesis C-methylase UbiE
MRVSQENKMPTLKREEILSINQKGWNKVAPVFYGGTALPKYGPLAQTEDELHLIPDLDGKKVFELGCGSGHSLTYLWENKNASEVWGLDLSEEQIRFTRELFEKKNIPVNLFLGSMDENPGIPENYFDLIISIYALGWTPDLQQTLALVYSYLKPGGVFIFSSEHPAYQCLEYNTDIGKYIFTHSYYKEGSDFHPSWRGVEIVLNSRTLSSYLNALAQADLIFDQLIESQLNTDSAREQDFAPEKWYSVPRAQLIPTTFIVKAHKPT